ncbi:MAG: hypothetical protein WAZ77_09735 [Candidatus Nitrosopolaris sp.]
MDEASERNAEVVCISSGGQLREEAAIKGHKHINIPNLALARTSLPYLIMPGLKLINPLLENSLEQEISLIHSNLSKIFNDISVTVPYEFNIALSAFLSSRKRLLEFAALSVIESIRQNPEKYSTLVYQNTSSTMNYTSPDFNPYYMYGQQQNIRSKIYFTKDYVAILSKDADKLLEKLVKELGDEVISGYTVSTSPSPSLPALLPSGEDSPAGQGAGIVRNTS